MDAYWRQGRLGKVHVAVIQLGTKAWTTAELTINQLFSWSDARRPWQRPRMELKEIKSILATHAESTLDPITRVFVHATSNIF